MYKTGTKRINENNWKNLFGLEVKKFNFLRFYSVKLKKIK